MMKLQLFESHALGIVVSHQIIPTDEYFVLGPKKTLRDWHTYRLKLKVMPVEEFPLHPTKTSTESLK